MKRSTWDCAGHFDPELSPPRLDALTTAVARRSRSHYGGEQPNATSVRFYDDYVVTAVEHYVRPADLNPAGRGPDEALGAELVRAAEQALGRRVLAHRTQAIPAAGIRFEIFELAGPRERGGGLQLVGVGRS